MCLILFSYQTQPKYRLILAANRDEYYDRPTEPLAFWNDRPDILAGRDLKRKGVWLGITRTGRICAITNFREPFLRIENAPSRGLLVSDFLAGQESPEFYLNQIKQVGNRYNGYNLLAGDGSGLFYYSNHADAVQKLTAGLYGLSNHFLNTPWPKVKKGTAALEALLEKKEEINTEDIFDILNDRSYPPDELLPNTGVDRDWERILSPLFITSEFYGTRSSSVVLVEKSGKITFAERTFEPEGTAPVAGKTRIFTLVAQT